MAILLFIALGLAVGVLVRELFPGHRQIGYRQIGIALTAVLGTAGSLVGGPLANLLINRPLFDLNAAGFVGSVVCGAVPLVAVGARGKNRDLI
jgi:uncharacterized membrane protein YeaQ/YmgE (transglycosylase-associated protein family)